MSEKLRANLSMIFVNIVWGLSFIASKQALSGGFYPFALAFVRFAIASLILLPILFHKEGLPKMPTKDWMRMIASALLGITLYFLFEYKGLERTSASTASLIVAAVPAFTLLFGVFFHKKKYPPICFVGVAASLFGVYLIVRYGAQDGSDSLIGNLLVVCAALSWVGYIEVTDGLMRKYSSLQVTAMQSVLGALALVPCLFTEPMNYLAVTPISWVMALYLAILCSVVAYLMYVSAIKVLNPLKTALFININPIAAVLGGVIFLGEQLTPPQLIGGAIVLLSIFLVNRRSVG